MEPLVIILAMVIIFFAGLNQGLVGFGLSLVSVPFLIILFDAQTIVPVLIIHGLLINIYLYGKTHKRAQIKRIWPLLPAAAAGIPVGTFILYCIEPQLFKLVIGFIIVIFGIAYLRNFSVRVRNEKLAFVPVGFASGVLNGCITLSGPPVVFFLTNQRVKKRTFRANMIAYFLFLNTLTLPFLFMSGLLSFENIRLAAILVPALILGGMSGSALVQKVEQGNFRTITLVVVTGSGILSVITGLGLI